MVTRGQAIIIKEICSIQLLSLENIFIKPNLESDSEELLKAVGASRKDFDTEVLKIREKFILLRDNPSKLMDLSYENLIAMLFIITHMSDDLQKKYPNSIKNLVRKIRVLLDTKEYLN